MKANKYFWNRPLNILNVSGELEINGLRYQSNANICKFDKETKDYDYERGEWYAMT